MRMKKTNKRMLFPITSSGFQINFSRKILFFLPIILLSGCFFDIEQEQLYDIEQEQLYEKTEIYEIAEEELSKERSGGEKNLANYGIATEVEESNAYDMFTEIMNGNFASVKTLDYPDADELRRIFDILSAESNIEWVQHDLDGDGLNELVWQEKDSHNQTANSIIGIFAFSADGAELVAWDVNDMTEYLFLSAAGNVIHCMGHYGTYSYVKYDHLVFDEEWNTALAYGLSSVCAYDDTEDIEGLKERFPYITELGIYYVKTSIDANGNMVTEQLGEQAFFDLFMETCGMPFYDMEPEWANARY